MEWGKEGGFFSEKEIFSFFADEFASFYLPGAGQVGNKFTPQQVHNGTGPLAINSCSGNNL